MKIRIAVALVVLAAAVSAHAQATRTWVSGVGDDVNPCSRTAPCKTFAGAISKTAAGGEISVLDPGGFGTVTITKSITIDGTGTLASTLNAGVAGIIINAAGINVVLRNMQIQGAGTGLSGVRIINANSVTLQNVTIVNCGGAGAHGVSIETGAKVRITDSQIYNSNANGVNSAPTSGTATLAVVNSAISGNGGSGIQLNNNTSASISRSVFSHNVQAGVQLAQGGCEANIHDSVMSFNAFGIFSGTTGSSVARIYGCQITNNTGDGLHLGLGTVESAGNNIVRGNFGNQTPSSNIGQQ